MGQEIVCRARYGEQESEGKALLETVSVVFKGGFRAKAPLASLSDVRVVDGRLDLMGPEGTLSLDLGPLAQAWANRIRNPPSLLSKLGVKAGQRVRLVGGFEPRFLDDIEAADAEILPESGSPADLLFLRADDLSDLSCLPPLRSGITRDGVIWIVYPKGQKHIRESDVFAAGKAAGLVDVKVARFSDTHTALKFVIPASSRQAI